MQYCIVDTDTGGLDPSVYSLLGISLIKVSPKFEKFKSLHLNLLSDPMVISPGAICANHFSFDTATIDYDTALLKITEFLGEHRYIPVGINLGNIDVPFLHKYLGINNYNKFFSSNFIDITYNYELLQSLGVIKCNSSSIASMCNTLGIEYDEYRIHESSYSSEIIRQLARALDKIITEVKSYLQKAN